MDSGQHVNEISTPHSNVVAVVYTGTGVFETFGVRASLSVHGHRYRYENNSYKGKMVMNDNEITGGVCAKTSAKEKPKKLPWGQREPCGDREEIIASFRL